MKKAHSTDIQNGVVYITIHVLGRGRGKKEANGASSYASLISFS